MDLAWSSCLGGGVFVGVMVYKFREASHGARGRQAGVSLQSVWYVYCIVTGGVCFSRCHCCIVVLQNCHSCGMI